MMKVKKLKVIIISMVIMTVSIVPISAASTVEQTMAEKIFPEKEVKADLEKARNQIVYSDKGSGARIKIGTTSSAKTTGTYPKRSGVIMVTSDKYKGLIPTGHAAIVYSKNIVVEALSKGVTKGKNNWEDSKDECWGVTTYNTTDGQDATVADMCYSEIGKPYNYNYLNIKTRSKYYCSHLIYAKYLDRYGIDLNTDAYTKKAVHPMELVNTSKTYTIYYNKNK